MTSAFKLTLIAAFVLAVLVAAEAKGKGPSITHKVPPLFPRHSDALVLVPLISQPPPGLL
jgi:hypothetical protein